MPNAPFNRKKLINALNIYSINNGNVYTYRVMEETLSGRKMSTIKA